MISYHPASATASVGTTFTAGFRAADTDDVARIAVCMSRFAWSQSVFKDGYRSGANFLFADWVALDFDSPEMSLGDAVRTFCDMIHVIGTTRSHQVDKGGVTCDRYRVLLKPERRIMSLEDYRATMHPLARKYPIDRAAAEGARHWFPCKEIISVEGDGFTVEVGRGKTAAQLAAERHFAQVRYQRSGQHPRWLRDFLETGATCRVGRNQTVYAAAITLAEVGMSEGEVVSIIEKAPFSREGFSREELERTVRSGFKRGRGDGSR